MSSGSKARVLFSKRLKQSSLIAQSFGSWLPAAGLSSTQSSLLWMQGRGGANYYLLNVIYFFLVLRGQMNEADLKRGDFHVASFTHLSDPSATLYYEPE